MAKVSAMEPKNMRGIIFFSVGWLLMFFFSFILVFLFGEKLCCVYIQEEILCSRRCCYLSFRACAGKQPLTYANSNLISL